MKRSKLLSYPFLGTHLYKSRDTRLRWMKWTSRIVRDWEKNDDKTSQRWKRVKSTSCPQYILKYSFSLSLSYVHHILYIGADTHCIYISPYTRDKWKDYLYTNRIVSPCNECDNVERRESIARQSYTEHMLNNCFTEQYFKTHRPSIDLGVLSQPHQQQPQPYPVPTHARLYLRLYWNYRSCIHRSMHRWATEWHLDWPNQAPTW